MKRCKASRWCIYAFPYFSLGRCHCFGAICCSHPKCESIGRGMQGRTQELTSRRSPWTTLSHATPSPCCYWRLVPCGKLLYPENGGSKFLRNADILLPDYKTLTSKNTVSSYLLQTSWNCVWIYKTNQSDRDRLCGLAIRVPGYISRGPGSIPGATRFSEK
jgi:hypothetical protein